VEILAESWGVNEGLEVISFNFYFEDPSSSPLQLALAIGFNGLLRKLKGGGRRRVRYPKFPGSSENAVITSSKYETAITDLLTNPSLTFREAALRHGLNASSVWYHYRMKHGYRRKVEQYE